MEKLFGKIKMWKNFFRNIKLKFLFFKLKKKKFFKENMKQYEEKKNLLRSFFFHYLLSF